MFGGGGEERICPAEIALTQPGRQRTERGGCCPLREEKGQ